MNSTSLAVLEWNTIGGSEDEFPYNVPVASVFEFVSVGILLTAVSLLGIVANLISLAVFARPEMRSSVNCCLQGLAMFDIAVLVCAFFMLGLRTLGRSPSSPFWFMSDYTLKVYPFVVPVLYPIALIAQTGSIWITVAVTVERYVAVCHPLRARSFCTHRRAKMYNMAVLGLSVAYNIPRFFEVERVVLQDPLTNVTFYAVTQSAFRSDRFYFRVYYIGLYLLFMYGIPFASLSLLNWRIWMTVRAANRDRRFLSRRLQKEFGLAVMLLCVVVIFMVCNALAPVTNVLEYLDEDRPRIVHLSNLLVVTNSASNLVVYCLFGHRFKNLFLYLFCTAYPRESTFYSQDSLRFTTSIRMSQKNSTNSFSTTRSTRNGSSSSNVSLKF